MEIYRGECISEGISTGKIKVLKRNLPSVTVSLAEPVTEYGIFSDALNLARKELKAFIENTDADKTVKEILNIHLMMSEDEDYINAVRDYIFDSHYTASYAVYMAGESFANMLSASGDEYTALRGDDIRDVSERIIGCISGNKEKMPVTDEAVIIAADELLPGDIAQLRRDRISACIVKTGAYNSHFSILARTMNIPVISNIEIKDGFDGKTAIVDTFEKTVYINPDKNIIEKAKIRMSDVKDKEEIFAQTKYEKAVFKDGREILVCANAMSADDVMFAIENGADGIGLFRSEFIYLNKTAFPDEDEQFEIYSDILRKANNKEVVIRTLDTDSDKFAPYMHETADSHKQLRGIGFSLKYPHILKTQLKALMRAAVFGDLSVMYPMIMNLEELDRIEEILKEAEKELICEGKKYGNFASGIMIETPDAVNVSDEFSQKADFISIGTNDLIRYTFNKDRNTKYVLTENEEDMLFDMIKTVCDNARKNGIKVSVCGEMASDSFYCERLILSGVDKLSVLPKKIPEIKYKIKTKV